MRTQAINVISQVNWHTLLTQTTRVFLFAINCFKYRFSDSVHEVQILPNIRGSVLFCETDL